jgi:uncharacterized protein YuzE
MKAIYDSEADALSIDVRMVHRWEGAETVDGDWQCNVSFSGGNVANVELLSPADHLELLSLASKRFDLDRETLLAAARAGLAAPDREVVVYVGRRLAGSS